MVKAKPVVTGSGTGRPRGGARGPTVRVDASGGFFEGEGGGGGEWGHVGGGARARKKSAPHGRAHHTMTGSHRETPPRNGGAVRKRENLGS